MHFISGLNFLKNNFFNIALALIPLSFIAGNMVININVILIILSAAIFYNKKLVDLKIYFLDKIIITFFILVIVTGLINDILVLNKLSWGTNFATTLRSLLFLKYLLFYFIVRFLIENEIIKLKYFFISASLASIFVCLDLFYQFVNGVDIFGYKIIPGFRKLGGPFGDELIAGSYIQRFSIFSFFVLPLFLIRQSKNYIKYLIPVLFFIFFLGIILSGNRMPFLLFLLTITLMLIFQKETRKYLLSFIIILPIFFITIYNSSEKVKSNFDNFYSQIYKITVIAVEGNFNEKTSPQYLKEFASFYETWRLNKYIGGGIKSFRYYCHVRENIDPNSKFVCNMHPHNYYLEILTETGLIGFILVISLFLVSLYLSFYKKYFSNTQLSQNNYIIPFIFLFIAEIFPIKSTGSFFTTGNTTYIFLILAILIGLIRKDNLFENKK